MIAFHVPLGTGQFAAMSYRFSGAATPGVSFHSFPTHTPLPLSRPAGRNRGASCGHVFKAAKCLIGRLLTDLDILRACCLPDRLELSSDAYPSNPSPSRRRADQLPQLKTSLRSGPQRAVEQALPLFKDAAKYGSQLPFSPQRGVKRGGGDKGGKYPASLQVKNQKTTDSAGKATSTQREPTP